MYMIRNALAIISLLSLSSCAMEAPEVGATGALYCDNFLVYEMCAQDMNRDGIVEYVYFPDSNEIFMYRAGTDGEVPAELQMHRCAVMMDEDLVATTSRVFFVDEATSYLEKQDIRGAMLIKYISYMPGVTACTMQSDSVAGAGSS
jgi:hypothetical protein